MRPGFAASVANMITSLGITQIFVLDQDQALDFYIGTLGLELVDDVDFGVMRWLTIRVPGEDRQSCSSVRTRRAMTRRPRPRSARW